MFQLFKKMFGSGAKTNYKELVSNGAIIVDVRSKGEFSGGHVKNSVNIPLDELKNKFSQVKNKEQHIITCCASGMRSASAKSFLKSWGYTNVHNAGSWNSLQNKIR